MKYIVSHTILSLTPGTLADEIAKHTKLTPDAAREGIDCALNSKFLLPPKEDGENYTLTLEGKRHARRKIGVFDQYIGSFKSSANFIAILALVVAVFALLMQVLAPTKVNSNHTEKLSALINKGLRFPENKRDK